MLRGRDPESTLTSRGVLSRQIYTLSLRASLPALTKSASAGAELGANGSVLLNPVGEGILTILDDASSRISTHQLVLT